VNSVLDVRDLRYELPENGRALVDGVSFSVGAGETLVLLGRSGAGKTTMLKLVNRLLMPTDGAIVVAGQRADAVEATQLRRRIGYVIQEVGLFPHFTVAANVGLLPRLEQWPSDRIARRVRESRVYCEIFPHDVSADELIERGVIGVILSGGQRQRVGVARALAVDPPLLLLDEPFGALDPITRLELQREFRTLKGRLQKAMVFVTHDVREGLLLGTQIGLLESGRLVFLGTPDEFRASTLPEVRQFMEAA